MLSPSRTTSRSPGTRVPAGTTCTRPPRHTRARAGRNAASASTARSAGSSWKSAKATLRTITAAIATAGDGVPLAQAGRPGHRQDQGEGMGDLSEQFRRPLTPAAARELVGRVGRQPSHRLSIREPRGRTAHVLQKQRERLGGIGRRRRLVHFGRTRVRDRGKRHHPDPIERSAAVTTARGKGRDGRASVRHWCGRGSGRPPS